MDIRSRSMHCPPTTVAGVALVDMLLLLVRRSTLRRRPAMATQGYFFLAFGLPCGFKFLMCKLDCEYLIHHSGEWPWSKHAVVICNNPNNWPKQQVISDAMEKGKVPIGVFVKIMYGHKAWLGEHKIDGTELAFIAVANLPHSMRGTSMGFGPMLRSHKHIEEIKADVDSTTNEHTEEAARADDADEHMEEAAGLPMSRISMRTLPRMRTRRRLSTSTTSKTACAGMRR